VQARAAWPVYMVRGSAIVTGMSEEKILVAGAGGFIGGHLVKYLQDAGAGSIVAVDVKPLEDWYQIHDGTETMVLDLRGIDACKDAVAGCTSVYNLAADMGGMGFIENNKALCMLSSLINTHLLMAGRDAGAKRFFFASSACVYNTTKQTDPDNHGLKEEDAYPALPEDGYGWEKLFSERMCRHFDEDFGLICRVARYHNVYGPHGTWDGGREKAPAALCRKVIEAKLSGSHEIEVWGDGEQTRSFTYIDDCLFGTTAIMASDVDVPINLGSDEMVSINQLVDIIEGIAEIRVRRSYDLDAPKGVRGRSSDNTLIQRELGWSPSISLRDGLEKTYSWIYDQIVARVPSRA
jgi:GDP-D-mannose 3',5'-epimerase